MSDIIIDDPNNGVRESWSERHLIQAIVLLEDAYSFRSIAHKLSPTNILKLYRLYWSKWTQSFLTLIVSCQLLLIFIQYPSSFSRTSDLRKERIRLTLPCSVQLIIEFLCLMIFYIDVIVRIYLAGLNHARKKPWIISYFIVTTMSMIDLIVSINLGCQKKTINIRYLLRPFYMAIISQEMKKIFNSLRKSFLQILSVTLLLGIHIYFFSVIGMILFPPAKRKDSTNDRIDEGTKYFPDFPDALINLVVLLTTANNPDVTLPAYSKNRLYIIYFAIFLTIGLYCLMTLFTVIKMNTFKEFFTTSMQNSLFRRRLAVRACFDILLECEVAPFLRTTDDTTASLVNHEPSRSTASMLVVTRVISGSNLPELHKRALLDILNRNNEQNGEVTLDIFSTVMLSLDADHPKELIEHHEYSGIWAIVQLIGASKYLTWFGNAIGLINFIILVVEGGLRYHPKFFKIDIILSNVLFSFTIYYFLETILKLWSLRPKIFLKYVFNTFDASLALSLVILHIIHWSIYGTLSITINEVELDAHGTARSIWAITRIINLFIIFRTIRSMPHFTNYGIIMGTISDGMRNLKAFIGILICLFYVYAVLGMWLFQGVIKAPTKSDLVNATCGSYQQSNYWANNFDDFFSTVVILYDVMLVNNWGVFLIALREFSTRWSQLYLVSWWFLSNVYILALVLGFIVELFALNVARFEESGFSQGPNGLANTYFVKTLFHLFKRSLKEPSDEEISKALNKYKRLYDNK
ncbi:unnamed protein product [Rotaria magnacalcarata]|uniref:Ion transport domain-containing protein n=1 Tax=Rotaria magnacalcarata TaxID=392030 RepID=A0A816T5R0_9BILA|nr:unnamed protein product [Rotaria magnacalcarata]CAF1437545.1 unnamed protein product [Rotaria magnacalcarata]CAF2022979.1 unnamed protein product [Rotaria magnacalcarata]CAF2095361.1 unnamed protein product [Rotaria magnacalcarata]CAF2190347.1 unnamed protein product [Rotaria magnacalcarata]